MDDYDKLRADYERMRKNEQDKIAGDVARERDALRALLREHLNFCASLRARVDKLRDALALAEIDVSLERSWCRVCCTEGRGEFRGRAVHPHEAGCVLADDCSLLATGEAIVCCQLCDHGSPCLLQSGHVTGGRHETQHGCAFYDALGIDT